MKDHRSKKRKQWSIFFVFIDHNIKKYSVELKCLSNNILLVSSYVTGARLGLGKYIFNASFCKFIRHMRMAQGLPNPCKALSDT